MLDAKPFFQGAGLLANLSRFTFLEGNFSGRSRRDMRYEKRETRYVSARPYLRAPACVSASAKEESWVRRLAR